MLRVLKYQETKEENIEIDMYIPINIEFGSWNISEEPTIYWRTGDLKNSLIEIGIGNRKKNIRSITLSIFKNIYEKEYYFGDDIDIIKGMPILELESSNNEIYIDEQGILDIFLGNTIVDILFSKNKPVKCLQNNDINFYIDKNNFIVGLRVNNISKEELFTLRSMKR